MNLHICLKLSLCYDDVDQFCAGGQIINDRFHKAFHNIPHFLNVSGSNFNIIILINLHIVKRFYVLICCIQCLILPIRGQTTFDYMDTIQYNCSIDTLINQEIL